MFLGRRKYGAQSAIEYVILLSLILSALLLTQGIVKRGYQGNLKDASDRMGPQYSPTSTSKSETRQMNNDQEINEEIQATRSDGDHVGISEFIPDGFGYEPNYIGDRGVYLYSERLDQDYTMETREQTNSVNQEDFRWNEAPATVYDDFPEPFIIP